MNVRNAFRCVQLAVLLTVGATAFAQEPGPDTKAIDQHLFTVLRDVINRGAEQYNNNNPAGCYYMFQGALQVAKPMLVHRPELQKFVQDSLGEAAGYPDMRQRAWSLRKTLDKVRGDLRGTDVARAPMPTPDPVAKPDAPPKPAPAPAPKGEPLPKPPEEKKPAEPSLWDRLGGQENVAKIVDDFVAAAAEDPKVNITRGGKFELTDEKVAALKKQLIAFISQATGGPLKYTGKSMKEVHKGMEITDAEFDAAGAALFTAMEKNGVKEEDIALVKKAVEGTRKDIVEKKDDEKKEEKKEAEKKDDDKKDEKKDAEKKDV